jgi:hypothetical protein
LKIGMTLVALVFVGCGGTGSSDTVVQGTVRGVPLHAVGSVATAESDPRGTASEVIIADAPISCGTGRVLPPRGSRALVIHFGFSSQGKLSPALATGTYSVTTGFYDGGTPPDGNVAAVRFASTDAQCNADLGSDSSAVAGSVQLTNDGLQSGDPTAAMAGSFSVLLDTGERLTGTFSAPFCTISSPDGGPTTCQ